MDPYGQLLVPHPEPVGERLRLRPGVREYEHGPELLDGVPYRPKSCGDLREREDALGERVVLGRRLRPDHRQLEHLLHGHPYDLAVLPLTDQEPAYRLRGANSGREPDELEVPPHDPL